MYPEATFDLPPALSTQAEHVDWLYYLILWISVAFFVGIVGTMLYFVWRYRRRPGVKSEPSLGDHKLLEIGWTFAPLILLVALFHWGFEGYVASAVAPDDAIEIRAEARQWSWTFVYPNGGSKPGELVIPVNRPVKIIMSSNDVLHSLFIPAFRVKKDVVPGMYSTLWFQATHETPDDPATETRLDNDIPLFCTEYCGLSHSGMLAKVYIVSEAEYETYLTSIFDRPIDIATDELWGERLFSQSGCTACHHTDATAQPAPSFQNLFGRTEHFEDGSELVVDENYIRESILRPRAKVVRGYANVVMPNFNLQEKQINALIAWIKTLH